MVTPLQVHRSRQAILIPHRRTNLNQESVVVSNISARLPPRLLRWFDYDCQTCRRNEVVIISLGKKAIDRFEGLLLASWLWRVFGQPIECRWRKDVHCQSGRASSHQEIPRRVSRISKSSRHRMGRTVCVGLNRSRMFDVGQMHNDATSNIFAPSGRGWIAQVTPPTGRYSIAQANGLGRLLTDRLEGVEYT